jgi:hypothetical protein
MTWIYANVKRICHVVFISSVQNDMRPGELTDNYVVVPEDRVIPDHPDSFCVLKMT